MVWMGCGVVVLSVFFFFSSRRRHTRCSRDWSSDVCSSDLDLLHLAREQLAHLVRELLANARPLTLPHALDDALLRGLHGRAAERLEQIGRASCRERV